METSTPTKLEQLKLELSKLEAELQRLPKEIAELEKKLQEKRKRVSEMVVQRYGSPGLIQHKIAMIEHEEKNELNKTLPNPVCDESEKYVILKVTPKRIYLRLVRSNSEFYVTELGNEYNRCKNFNYAATRAAWEEYATRSAASLKAI